MSASTWTPEQRQRQAEAIKRWKPWEQSTGPKCAQGKAAVSGNAYTGGEWAKLRECVRKLNQALREQKDLLK